MPPASARPTWSPDGTLVYFLASDARTADERERDRVRDDVLRVDETFKQRHLWKIVVVDRRRDADHDAATSTVIEYSLSARRHAHRVRARADAADARRATAAKSG